MSSTSPKAVDVETETVTEPRPAIKIKVDRKDAIIGVVSFLLGAASVILVNKIKDHDVLEELSA